MIACVYWPSGEVETLESAKLACAGAIPAWASMETNKISYIGVKALIVDDAGNVLITQEPLNFVGGGKWELPGGKIANGEENTALEDILMREVREELGPYIDISIGKVIDVMRRPWNKPGASADQVMLAVFECRYQGGEIVLSEENNAYTWISGKELPEYEFVPGYPPVLEKYLLG